MLQCWNHILIIGDGWTINDTTPRPVNVQILSVKLPLFTGIALHIAKRGEISAGDTVVVIGPGAIGSIAYQCAKALGAGRVIVVGRGHRLEKAEELGYEVIDYEKDNPVDSMKIKTEGKGAFNPPLFSIKSFIDL